MRRKEYYLDDWSMNRYECIRREQKEIRKETRESWTRTIVVSRTIENEDNRCEQVNRRVAVRILENKGIGQHLKHDSTKIC